MTRAEVTEADTIVWRSLADAALARRFGYRDPDKVLAEAVLALLNERASREGQSGPTLSGDQANSDSITVGPARAAGGVAT